MEKESGLPHRLWAKTRRINIFEDFHKFMAAGCNSTQSVDKVQKKYSLAKPASVYRIIARVKKDKLKELELQTA